MTLHKRRVSAARKRSDKDRRGRDEERGRMVYIPVKPSFQPKPRFVSVKILPSDPTERELEVVRQPEPPEPKDWRTIIVDRIRSDEISYNLLGQEAGVSPAIISRFVRGERDITLSVAYRLCLALDLVLVPREQCR